MPLTSFPQPSPKMNPKPTKKTKPSKVATDKEKQAPIILVASPADDLDPTTAELAQLAAALPPLKGRDSLLDEWEQERYLNQNDDGLDGSSCSFSPTQILAREALALWESCSNLLRDERERELREEKTGIQLAKLERDAIPCHPFLDPFQQTGGPFPFEEALKALIGEKTRRTDRYRIFRNYLRHHFKVSKTKGKEIESKVDAKFTQLNEDGFTSPERFRRLKEKIDKWRTELRKSKARHAAEERYK